MSFSPELLGKILARIDSRKLAPEDWNIGSRE